MEILEAAGWIALGFVPTLVFLYKGAGVMEKISSILAVSTRGDGKLTNDKIK